MLLKVLDKCSRLFRCRAACEISGRTTVPFQFDQSAKIDGIIPFSLSLYVSVNLNSISPSHIILSVLAFSCTTPLSIVEPLYVAIGFYFLELILNCTKKKITNSSTHRCECVDNVSVLHGKGTLHEPFTIPCELV